MPGIKPPTREDPGIPNTKILFMRELRIVELRIITYEIVPDKRNIPSTRIAPWLLSRIAKGCDRAAGDYTIYNLFLRDNPNARSTTWNSKMMSLTHAGTQYPTGYARREVGPVWGTKSSKSGEPGWDAWHNTPPTVGPGL